VTRLPLPAVLPSGDGRIYNLVFQGNLEMRSKTNVLPNQLILPVDPACVVRNSSKCRDCAGSGDEPIIPISASGRDDCSGKVLADRRNHSLSRLRNQDRAPWFVDDDDDGPCGPAAA